MTLVTPVGYGTVVHQMMLAGDPEPMVNTYGIRVTDGAVWTGQELAVFLHDAFADFFCNQNDNNWTVTSTEVKMRTGAGPLDFSLGLDVTQRPGTASALATLPVNCAYLLHKRSAVPGRGGRGRLYLLSVPETQCNDLGQLTGSTASDLTTAATTWLTAINGNADLDGMVILHDSNGAFADSEPALVTNLVCDPVIATMRRRLRR